MPFSFEGRKRKQQADRGIEELRKYVDAVLIISNDKLRELYGNLGLSEAFRIADNVLLTAAKGIAEIITVKAYVNIDFKDVNTVMKNSGVAIMGTGTAEGDNRARNAISMALNSPLLDDNDIKGTNDILLYLSSGNNEISMDEITEITEYILDEAGQQVEIIWGAGRDDSLGENIRVTVVATGFDKQIHVEPKKVEFDLYGNHPKTETPKEVTLPRPTRPAIEPVFDEDDGEEDVDEIRLIIHDESDDKDPITNRTSDEKPKVVFNLEDRIPEINEAEPSSEFSAHHEEVKRPETIEFQISEIPAVRKPDIEDEELVSKEEKESLEKRTKERIERLRQMSIKLKSPGGLTELESEPAYRRKNVELSDEKPSEDSKISKFTLSEGDEDGAELKSDNSFLHDNVD